MHTDGPLLLLGGAGTGKTRALIARFGWLVEQGVAPERIALLASSAGTAAALRTQVEGVIERAYEELAVASVPELCARLLRGESPAAGLDPFAAAASGADRLALLLERIDELPLRSHDFQGNPAALLASFIERIDRLKAELVTVEEYAEWAAGLPDGEAAEQEREFAAVYRAHDALLSDMGMLDTGDLVLRAHALLAEGSEARPRLLARFDHVLVDELEELDLAPASVARALAGGGATLVAASDPDQAIQRFRAAAGANVRAVLAERPAPRVVRLERSLRCGTPILTAARAVVEPVAELERAPTGSEGGEVAFWRCDNERAQAQSVAADVEALLAGGVAPESVCVLVRSVRREGQAVAVALDERAVPHRLVGAAAFFQRAEIRDVLAWLRLLADPGDAGAVVRALARPPVELRSIDLARCIQISRRRKLDMVSALVAATESPQIPPEARERILEFLKRYRSASAALDTTRPDLFVHRLIERLGLRRQQLFAAQADVVERLVNLAKFGEMASAYVRRAPQATPREFARYIAAVAEAGLREEEATGGGEAAGVRVMAMHDAKGLEFEHAYVLGLQSARMPGARRRAPASIPDALLHESLPPDSREAHVAEMRRLLALAMTRARTRLVLSYAARSDRGDEQPPSPFAETARAALGADWEEREEELFGPAESLHATFRMLREELLETVARTAGRLGELRFDTDLDVSHAVVRYLELIKLAALIERQAEQSVEDALPEINARLGRAVTAEQREIFQTSALDDYVLDTERSERRRAAAVAAREEPSLEAFLPRRGEGLVLSAGDVETYRICPLRYKFARVFRIPTEPTIHQRFGILVHQVLERFHAAGGGQTLAELLGLLDAGWRRNGFGGSEEERQLREKAGNALTRYFERFQTDPAEPLWFERSFSFPLGPHLLRGRVDRVDRLPDGGYELIDYKTGRPKTAAQLREDVQLSLYAVGAREAWQLDASHQAYYYLLDDEKVPVERDEHDRDWIMETVLEVAEGILAQGFEPTPSYAACSTCDFRIICPAAEK
ncbi:MAG: ATP-dependent helicase UvrD/PcrA [Solirubrobacteraceae bacterium]|nr:ATP-dependent helicase UvrD/PcrA [Solirubrobacteraceae bacterium]